MRHTTPCEDSHRQYPQVVGSKQCVPQTRPKRILTSTNRVCWFEWVADSLCGWVWGCCEPGFATLALHYDTSKGTRYPSQGDSLSSPNGKFRGFGYFARAESSPQKSGLVSVGPTNLSPLRRKYETKMFLNLGPKTRNNFLNWAQAQKHPETIVKITRLNSRKSPVPLEKTSVWNSLWI